METKVTTANFAAEVENSSKPVLVDFFATWCQPCRMIAPFVAQVAEERPDIKVCKVDIDENGALAGRFGIDSIP
ncbi:MAG: thiol reductase thioredoxin, partial [Clostridia bacterium]|nr:thiol reductase thioredoxin [Clostridia bacterium]